MEGKPRQRWRVYLLPNLFTSLNIMAGFYSIISVFNDRFSEAAIALLVAILFDGLDGQIARMTATTSRFGVEYDSLADLISFGLAPGLLLYAVFLKPMGRLGWLAAFLMLACAALRLARYNLQYSREERFSFQGLPTPGAAGLAASITLFDLQHGGPGDQRTWLVLLVAYILAFLMISTIPYRATKSFDLRRPRPFTVLVFTLLVLVVVVLKPVIFLVAFFALYVASGPVELFFSHRIPGKVLAKSSSIKK